MSERKLTADEHTVLMSALKASTKAVPMTDRELLKQAMEALRAIESGSFPGASEVVLSGNWHGFATILQGIARTTLDIIAEALKEGTE